MSIWEKSIKVEVTLGVMIDMMHDAAMLESTAILLEEKEACALAKMIRNVANDLNTFTDRIEEAFDEGEGS